MERSNFYDSREAMRTVSIPISLYKSLQGRYFTGISQIEFSSDKQAWAGVINPKNSDINLHIDFYSVENLSDYPFTFQVWLNPILFSGEAKYSDMLGPSNTALRPVPISRIQFLYANNANELPEGGLLIYSRKIAIGSTIEVEEHGRYIFPPGGSFLINCIASDMDYDSIKARVAFRWWEDMA